MCPELTVPGGELSAVCAVCASVSGLPPSQAGHHYIHSTGEETDARDGHTLSETTQAEGGRAAFSRRRPDSPVYPLMYQALCVADCLPALFICFSNSPGHILCLNVHPSSFV